MKPFLRTRAAKPPRTQIERDIVRLRVLLTLWMLLLVASFGVAIDALSVLR